MTGECQTSERLRDARLYGACRIAGARSYGIDWSSIALNHHETQVRQNSNCPILARER